MSQKIDLDKQSYLFSDINISSMHRHNLTTPNWCSDTTSLTIQPDAGKKILITRVSFVTYNAATDFTKTIKLEHYDGTIVHEIISAVGYTPLLVSASRIDSFKIGTDDVVLISWLFRNSIRLNNANEYLKFSTSAAIDGTDKFYGGISGVEYED